MKEIWKEVPGSDSCFEISNLGNIRRIKIKQYSFKDKNIKEYKTQKLIKPANDRGYLKIRLLINGKQNSAYIHRLVAEAFIPNPNNYKEVNHKDNDPSNNNVENLEWCDRKYNINYMIKHQEEIKNRHELRLETLENIYYGIELGKITKVEEVKDLIDESLLNQY